MKIFYLKNFRKGYATNSSSTHSVIYKNKGEVLEDLNIFELNYYDRCDRTIAATREAKIKYIAANIMYSDELYEIMCQFYPEMKQYENLIKKQKESDSLTYDQKMVLGIEDNVFGMTSRGPLYFYGSENLSVSLSYLRGIIDNDDLIIVGGSDEGEFYYDTIEGHKELTDPSDINGTVYKNGNYYVGYGYAGKGRVRFSASKEDCIPRYPELIDLKVTNKCSNGCHFCLTDDTMIETDDGLKKITDIKKGDFVMSFSHLNYEFQVKQVDDVYERDYEGELYEIELEDGKTVKCTPNHKIYTTNRGWVEAEKLTENDDLLIF